MNREQYRYWYRALRCKARKERAKPRTGFNAVSLLVDGIWFFDNTLPHRSVRRDCDRRHGTNMDHTGTASVISALETFGPDLTLRNTRKFMLDILHNAPAFPLPRSQARPWWYENETATSRTLVELMRTTAGEKWFRLPARERRTKEVKCCDEWIACTRFTNTCQLCGAEYNMSGHLREQWGEETGESVFDILAIDTSPYRGRWIDSENY